MKAFGYLRVSGRGQENGDGFPRQRLAIEQYAAAQGIEIIEWFEERAVPGKTEWENRPAWVRMMLALNGTSTIIVESLNRLARDLMVQEHIIADTRSRGIALISVAEPDLCHDDPSRKLLRQIMGAIAEYDRAMIVLKLKGARQRIKSATGKCEGRKLYGDKPGEAAILENMKFARHHGKTLQFIVDCLNEAGTPTRAGGKWSVGTVGKILAREQNAAREN